MDNFLKSIYLRHLQTLKNSTPEKLLKLISAIEYVEAIFEISATKLFGQKFKWFIIFVTQAAKCLLRLCLLLFHKIAIQPSPKLFELKNFFNMDNKKQPIRSSSTYVAEANSSASNTFKLKHSDRRIRSVHDAPDLNSRDWILNANENINEHQIEFDPTRETHYLISEFFYIIRPVTHLTILYLFNSKSWLQYVIPLLMDSTNVLLMTRSNKLSKNQKIEMKRRTYLLLNYILRSPAYESCTKSLIDVTLNVFQQKLPGARFIANPLRNYIPEWRSVYSYLWAS